MACLGPIQFFIALVNDYVSYGVSRSLTHLGLIISYLVLALTDPKSSSYLYVWVLQWVCGLCKFTLIKFKVLFILPDFENNIDQYTIKNIERLIEFIFKALG